MARSKNRSRHRSRTDRLRPFVSHVPRSRSDLAPTSSRALLSSNVPVRLLVVHRYGFYATPPLARSKIERKRRKQCDGEEGKGGGQSLRERASVRFLSASRRRSRGCAGTDTERG